MQTVRRLYLYAVSFFSLEVIIWGIIGLLRSLTGEVQWTDDSSQLAGSLSLILVGLPIFLFHFWLAQRSAARDIRERSARVRAFFLYGTLVATLLPAILNFLALLNRSLLSFFGANPQQAILGGTQSYVENLVAVVINLLAAGFIFLLLRADWQKTIHGNAYAETRRLFRLFWLIIALGLIVLGLRFLLQFVFALIEVDLETSLAALPNAISLLLVSLPLWFSTSRLLERSQSDPSERSSFLRLAVLYTIAFVSLGTMLVSAGPILESILRVLLGSGSPPGTLLDEIRNPLVNAIALGIVWIYYDRSLQEDRKSEDRPAGHMTLYRLYRSLYAFFGLAAAFLGLQMLLEILINFLFFETRLAVETSTASLATSLAYLIIGLPLWLVFWRSLLAEVRALGEVARRSLVRKSYLYWILFLGVTGFMFSAGQLVFQFLRNALGDPPENLQQSVFLELKNLLLYAIVTAYHFQVLKQDSRLEGESVVKRRTLYPVLVLVPSDGDFAERIVASLEHFLPGLPVALHPVSSGAPDESLTAAKAVILPFDLLARPPEALRLWLQSFPGERLVVPSPLENWHWIGSSRKSTRDPYQQAALAVRDLVEGRVDARV